MFAKAMQIIATSILIATFTVPAANAGGGIDWGFIGDEFMDSLQYNLERNARRSARQLTDPRYQERRRRKNTPCGYGMNPREAALDCRNYDNSMRGAEIGAERRSRSLNEQEAALFGAPLRSEQRVVNPRRLPPEPVYQRGGGQQRYQPAPRPGTIRNNRGLPPCIVGQAYRPGSCDPTELIRR